MTELYSLIGATKPERLPQIRGSEQVEEMTLEQVSMKDKLSDREEHNHTESHQKSNRVLKSIQFTQLELVNELLSRMRRL